MIERRLLAIYLNDHLAGATGGVELARRSRASNSGTKLGDALVEICAEIEADRATLERVMEQLEVKRDRTKVAGAWAAEKLGRLKLNGRLTGYSPLSRLVELEMLHIGITGKLQLWQALKETRSAKLARIRPARPGRACRGTARQGRAPTPRRGPRGLCRGVRLTPRSPEFQPKSRTRKRAESIVESGVQSPLDPVLAVRWLLTGTTGSI